MGKSPQKPSKNPVIPEPTGLEAAPFSGVSPNGDPRPGPPRKPRSDDVRPRGEWLTEDEVDAIRKAAAKVGRHGHRDATMILIAYTHALRVSELLSLRWEQLDLKARTIFVKRLKGSQSGTHPLRKAEVAALKKLGGDRRGHIFASERGGPLTSSAIHKMIARAGRLATIPFPVHPHMLRHGCGYKLTNDGHDVRAIQVWMGHKNIQHTVHYTHLVPARFERLKFWED